jgi:hypothetical protein
MHPSDASSCNTWFKHGKSFPDNVKDAICNIPEAQGPTGPTGPLGPSGLHGGGVDTPATCTEVLEGVNGENPATYVDPSGWRCASDRYYANIFSTNITDETFTPDALDYNIFDITHSGNCVISEPVNMFNGRTISIALRQAGAGNNTIAFNPKYEFDGGWNNITLTSGAKDVMVATKINDFYFCTMANDIKTGISQSHSLVSATVIM